MTHPLDRPVWNALAGSHAAFALGDARARRYRPEVNVFGAAADPSPASLEALAALVPLGGELGMVEAAVWPIPPGTAIVSHATIDQMVATGPAPPVPDFAPVALGAADRPEILELATLCRPGPFYAETWRMGDFIGLREDGRLIAMAGQRWRVPGHVEVSAVCTRPEVRGRGLAGALIRILMARIRAGGAVPFLHVYPDNAGAIGLYRSLGFEKRADIRFTVVTRAPAPSADTAPQAPRAG